MTNEEIAEEVQKLKEENSSLKALLEALNTKVAQMQIKLNTISVKVGVNTSYVLANSLIDNSNYNLLIHDHDCFREEEE